jgi:hypothetical protein
MSVAQKRDVTKIGSATAVRRNPSLRACRWLALLLLDTGTYHVEIGLIGGTRGEKGKHLRHTCAVPRKPAYSRIRLPRADGYGQMEGSRSRQADLRMASVHHDQRNETRRTADVCANMLTSKHINSGRVVWVWSEEGRRPRQRLLTGHLDEYAVAKREEQMSAFCASAAAGAGV